MSNSLNWNTYKKINISAKELNNYNNIECAINGAQKSYEGKSCLKNVPERFFTIIQCRKGHKRPHLSYTLMGKSYDYIMRVDLYGPPHDGIPTPHIHIFVPDDGYPCTTYPLNKLKGYDLSKDPKRSFINFLKYNNFIKLDQLHFANEQLSLFNTYKGGIAK